jgi:hypothetical protein
VQIPPPTAFVQRRAFRLRAVYYVRLMVVPTPVEAIRLIAKAPRMSNDISAEFGGAIRKANRPADGAHFTNPLATMPAIALLK